MQRQTILAMTAASPSSLHALHKLADYPVLAAFARERTTSKKLDGRACRHIYDAALAMSLIDWQAVSESERAFMRSLGIDVMP